MPNPIDPPLLIGSQRLLVPAYFSPRQTLWRDSCNAMHTGLLRGVLVMNPNSGPGMATDAQYRAAMTHCQSHRQSVIGYVSTQHGARPAGQVQADVDRYFQFYPGIRGIFFDEMSNGEDKRAHYRSLYAHVKEKSATARVVGNPGIPASSPWQLTPPIVADVLVVFEGPYIRTANDDPDLAQYKDWSPPDWVLTRPADLFAHLIYESPDPATTLAICAASFQRKNAGWIYVTRDVRPNPWDAPPDEAMLGSPTLERQQLVGP